MPHIQIEYCVPCGHRDKALETADDLLDRFARDLSDVALVPGDGGVFKVYADGEVVYDKAEAGYDPGAITDAVADRLST